MLLHDNMPARHSQTGRRLVWYPLWDANIRIDHSVRTVREALKVAGEDISAGLAMLEVRHIVGDSDLSSLLIGGARRQWRTGIASRFDELVEHAQARWQRSGQIAHRAEPDLKCGRGGLRDVQLLNALAIAQLADVYPSRSLASPSRLAGRGASGPAQRAHRTAPGVAAAAANYCWPSTQTRSGRRCGSVTDSTWRACSPMPPAPSATTSMPGLRTAGNALPRRGLRRLQRPVRRPLDEGVIEFAGEVILARDARPERDPGLIRVSPPLRPAPACRCRRRR